MAAGSSSRLVRRGPLLVGVFLQKFLPLAEWEDPPPEELPGLFQGHRSEEDAGVKGGHPVAAELWERGGRVLETGAHVGHALVKPGGNLTGLRHHCTKAGVLTNTVLDYQSTNSH